MRTDRLPRRRNPLAWPVQLNSARKSDIAAILESAAPSTLRKINVPGTWTCGVPEDES